MLTGALITVGLGAAAPAAATTGSAPTLETRAFACDPANGVCEVGPGNAGVAFAAALIAVGGQCSPQGGGTPEVTEVARGSLPPGLRFGPPGQEAQITGTPTKAGTFSFAVQLANVNGASGQICGPAATQQLTITIGTGTADRLILYSTLLNDGCGTDPPVMQLESSDANSGATYTVTQTSTGTRLATFTGNEAGVAILRRFGVPAGTFPRGLHPGSVTVIDTAGGSATIPVRQVSGC